ncbi:MAG TPA: glycosyltransferase family 2 protein [Arenibaculum sp.]|nr:glycosyltransferase family 2 protein [Arenibaculum sp.]
MSLDLEAVAIVSALLAGLPVAVMLLNLPFYRPPRERPPDGPDGAAVSVLIPARDEAATIEAAVQAALASRNVDLEVVVLDDHSTDGTADIVRMIAAADPRVRVVPAPPLPAGWSGKQHACATLARLARHPLLVFVDADVRLAPDALVRIAGFVAARRLALASGFPRQETGTLAEKLVIPLMHLLLLGYLPMLGMRFTRMVGFGAGCGQLIACDAAAYRAAGGHGAIRRSLHDGLSLPRAFRRAGLRTDLFDANALARCRMYHGAGEVWRGLSKNATEGMATPLGLPVWTVLLAGGHLLPFLLLAAGTGTAAFPAAALAAALSLGARLSAALLFRQSLIGALLHPAGIAILLAIQWSALLRARLGRPVPWRGRAYLPE